MAELESAKESRAKTVTKEDLLNRKINEEISWVAGKIEEQS
jgi:hypothetical protein